MTTGELLRYFRTLAGIETKSEFARQLGFKDPDHYTGSENDTPGKEPSLDLLRKAARLAGVELEDYIHIPESKRKPISKEHEKVHRQLQDLLDVGGEAGDWISGNIKTFHRSYCRRR